MAMAPHVAMEVLNWQPLLQPAFDHFIWYNQLFSYGVTENSADDDPDHQLVPPFPAALC